VENLRRDLKTAGIRLKPSHAYEADIARLKQLSTRTLNDLLDQSRITLQGTTLKATRTVVQVLSHAARESSLLVVGAPGAGKSGVLYELGTTELEQGNDVLMLAVDQIAARSLSDLRLEIGLEHELSDVLTNWPGESLGFVLIDALDAARGDLLETALRNLMRSTVGAQTRWRVIASVRKYDLRYGTDLRQLFSGNILLKEAIGFRDPEFPFVRHISVPLFSSEDLRQLCEQSLGLNHLLQIAPPELSELLKVPFNLRLMAALLDTGLSPEELTPVQTQIELLERYWEARVTRSKDVISTNEY
jgi:hypothetical protein